MCSLLALHIGWLQKLSKKVDTMGRYHFHSLVVSFFFLLSNSLPFSLANRTWKHIMCMDMGVHMTSFCLGCGFEELSCILYYTKLYYTDWTTKKYLLSRAGNLLTINWIFFNRNLHCFYSFPSKKFSVSNV